MFPRTIMANISFDPALYFRVALYRMNLRYVERSLGKEFFHDDKEILEEWALTVQRTRQVIVLWKSSNQTDVADLVGKVEHWLDRAKDVASRSNNWPPDGVERIQRHNIAVSRCHLLLKCLTAARIQIRRWQQKVVKTIINGDKPGRLEKWIPFQKQLLNYSYIELDEGQTKDARKVCEETENLFWKSAPDAHFRLAAINPVVTLSSNPHEWVLCSEDDSTLRKEGVEIADIDPTMYCHVLEELLLPENDPEHAQPGVPARLPEEYKMVFLPTRDVDPWIRTATATDFFTQRIAEKIDVWRRITSPSRLYANRNKHLMDLKRAVEAAASDEVQGHRVSVREWCDKVFVTFCFLKQWPVPFGADLRSKYVTADDRSSFSARMVPGQFVAILVETFAWLLGEGSDENIEMLGIEQVTENLCSITRTRNDSKEFIELEFAIPERAGLRWANRRTTPPPDDLKIFLDYLTLLGMLSKDSKSVDRFVIILDALPIKESSSASAAK
jgi:hypothetical protein